MGVNFAIQRFHGPYETRTWNLRSSPVAAREGFDFRSVFETLQRDPNTFT